MAEERALQEYRDKVAEAVLGFQYLEEGIKSYIYSSYEALAAMGHPAVHIDLKRTASRLKKMSLGALIKEFQVFNDNSCLHKRLSKLPTERNRIVHRAYLEVFEVCSTHVPVETRSRELDIVLAAARQCMQDIRMEYDLLAKRFSDFYGGAS